MASSQTQPTTSAPTPPSIPNSIHKYLVVHVATTCDEHGVYVTKDSAEVIEVAWILVDARTMEEIERDSVLVKPINTPITPLCTSLTTITWEIVRPAGTFRDAITRLDEFIREKIPSKEEFAFVTLDAWDLRVQLPREARDKNVVLPAYLQHSRTFDLRTEYSNWQQYHPESLPFAPSSLSNICAALEVEAVQSSAPIKHNLPFHLQALAPASPRRAMEEAVTLLRVTRGLVRKSQPYSDHPTVLMHLMDARADVRAFLSERSKVLFLNGLPHDTTQSELESWFTQFGGRPIAFWTMRTPDQHKPTGHGFAVFSSHEEAAEALCMNGRALNEKAIEVSPSSNRVLERAGEVLTPFPPSKNRPRPGDWTCPSCGFSNFQRRTACFRCSFPAMAAPPAADPNMGYGYGYPPSGPPMMPYNHAHPNPSKSMGASAPFRPGDWRCGVPDCMYHNFAKNVSCLRCGGSRANAIPMTAPNQFVAGPPPPHFGGHPPMGGFMDQGAGPPGAPGAGPPPMGVPSGFGVAGPGAAPFHPGGFGPSGMGYPGAGFDGLGPAGYGTAPGVLPPGSGFDSRAEAAFAGASAGTGGPGAPSVGGPPGFSTNGGVAVGSGYDGGADPFGFLGTGLAGLSLDENNGRRNGAHGASGPGGKSPAA